MQPHDPRDAWLARWAYQIAWRDPTDREMNLEIDRIMPFEEVRDIDLLRAVRRRAIKVEAYETAAEVHEIIGALIGSADAGGV